MFKLTGQEVITTAPIDRNESWTSPKVQPYTDAHMIVAFETRGKKILVIEKEGQLMLPAKHIALRQRNTLDCIDAVIEDRLKLKSSQIRDEHHKFPVRILGSVAMAPSLYMFLKVPIIEIKKPGWHYINDQDLPMRGDQVEPAFLVLATTLWQYSPVTAQ